MAGLRAIAQTAEVALAAGATKTVLQLVAPANQRLRVFRWGVYFDGTDASQEAIQVELVRQTTAGTMSALSTLEKLDEGAPETLQATARHTATVEPTTGNPVDAVEVHPQSGYETVLPPGDEVWIKGGGRLGLRCITPAGVTVNVRAKLVFEE